jgi:hypothetical protein
VIEAVEGAAKAIVAEEVSLSGLEAQMLGDTAGGPRRKSVEGTACQQEVGDEDSEGDDGRNVFATPAGGRQITLEERLEVETLQEAADDRRSADFEGFEGGVVEGVGHRCLSAGKIGREGCYGSRRADGNEMREAKKSSLGCRSARASLARIFLLAKEPGRERSTA